MAARQARNVIVDSGFWFALFEPRDQHAKAAQTKAHHIDALTVIFPWPTLYETLGTRFVKNRIGMASLERMLSHPNVEFVDDVPCRNDALDATFQESRIGRRTISLCDMLIRLMIQDTNVQVAALLTFNAKDFLDVCRAKRVEIL
jgi:predicted nucleic acid-binding protein